MVKRVLSVAALLIVGAACITACKGPEASPAPANSGYYDGDMKGKKMTAPGGDTSGAKAGQGNGMK